MHVSTYLILYYRLIQPPLEYLYMQFIVLLFYPLYIVLKLNKYFFIFKEWELLVISKLEWRIVAVTSFDYVDHIMEQIKWKRRNDSMLRRHMLTLISFCYIGK